MSAHAWAATGANCRFNANLVNVQAWSMAHDALHSAAALHACMAQSTPMQMLECMGGMASRQSPCCRARVMEQGWCRPCRSYLPLLLQILVLRCHNHKADVRLRAHKTQHPMSAALFGILCAPLCREPRSPACMACAAVGRQLAPCACDWGSAPACCRGHGGRMAVTDVGSGYRQCCEHTRGC